MHIQELDKYIDRKQLLLRQIDNKYVEEDVALQEIEEINKKISLVVSRKLAEERDKLKTDIKEGTKKVFTDGNFKRTVARVIIGFLKEMYTDDEVRGIMRQGYKIQRGR